MVTVGLLVRLVAKAGKEAEVAGFLEGGLSLVEQEPAQAPELLAQPPTIQPVDVLAAKLPG
jgi:hypothetical protein